MINSQFFQSISAPKRSQRWVIGLSGGLDSTVLLWLCAQYRDECRPDLELMAVHVNHLISPSATQWQAHCLAVCEQLKVRFETKAVEIAQTGRRSLEQVARDKRYQVFQQICEPDDLLLLAHHLDDQVVTLLYRLARGSGVLGLRGMDEYVQRGNLSIWRPLISSTRQELEHYCKAQQLDWVEDPSNQDTRYDRNFIRHELVPLMETRWSALRQTLGRSSRLLGEASELVDDLARIDLENCLHQGSLDISALQQLSVARRKNCLRFWIADFGAALPSEKVLAQVVACIANYHEELNADISWSGDFSGQGKVRWQVHTFRGQLYLEQWTPSIDSHWEKEISEGVSLGLPSGLGVLVLSRQSSRDGGLALSFDASEPVTVRFRQGGESFRPVGRKQKLLKKWLQEWNIPPWKRDRIPLIFQGDKLVAVAGQAVAEGFQPEPGESSLILQWAPSAD